MAVAVDGHWPLFALAVGVPVARELAAIPEPVLMQPVMDAAAKKTPAHAPTVRLVMTAFPANPFAAGWPPVCGDFPVPRAGHDGASCTRLSWRTLAVHMRPVKGKCRGQKSEVRNQTSIAAGA